MPPPEIRAIVDKTASYVAKNGRDFAARILGTQGASSAKFDFLKVDNVYHAYYEAKVVEFAAKAAEPAAAPAAAAAAPAAGAAAPAAAAPTEDTPMPGPAAGDAAGGGGGGDAAGGGGVTKRAAVMAPVAMAIKRAPSTVQPPKLAFLLEHPAIAEPVDIDVIKLMAQVRARNGEGGAGGRT